MNSYLKLNRLLTPIFSILTTLIVSACGGGSSSDSARTTTNASPTIFAANVVPVSVNSGGDFNSSNSLYVSVTLCSPTNANNCTTIDRILVDTGSVGLRVFAQPRSTPALSSLNLTQQTVSGKPIAQCLPFVQGSTWGPIKLATLKMGQKTANNVAIQVIQDPAFSSVPTPCSSQTFSMLTVPEDLRANGILGIGLFPQDCGINCTTSITEMNVYYSCSADGKNCVNTAQSIKNQIQNPAGIFEQDNNGVILTLDAVPKNGATSIEGTLTFGIDAQNANKNSNMILINNDPNSATYGYFTTTVNGTDYRYSFVDSGSNGYFFTPPASTPISECTTYAGYFCPSSTVTLNATMSGSAGSSAPANVIFDIAHTESLFTSTANVAFDNIGGGSYMNTIFDWGLPFFFGKSVHIVQAGKTTARGNGPYIGF